MVSKKSQSNRSERANARQVSLPRRRTGQAIIILSPTSEALSYGAPCCEAIMKRLGGSPDVDGSWDKHMAEHEADISKLTKEYEDLLQEIAFEKRRAEELDRLPKEILHPLSKRPITELNLNELSTLKAFWLEKKAQIEEIAEKCGFSFTSPDYGSASAEAITVKPDGITAKLNGHVSNGL
ncbi:hypothetical protein M5689_013495 [Euphorbia peplus]|nr:hypothetical protein M5689_013495 [Euphorbia peplus]